jgi:hypothetical protein
MGWCEAGNNHGPMPPLPPHALGAHTGTRWPRGLEWSSQPPTPPLRHRVLLVAARTAKDRLGKVGHKAGPRGRRQLQPACAARAAATGGGCPCSTRSRATHGGSGRGGRLAGHPLLRALQLLGVKALDVRQQTAGPGGHRRRPCASGRGCRCRRGCRGGCRRGRRRGRDCSGCYNASGPAAPCDGDHSRGRHPRAGRRDGSATPESR